MTEIQFMNKMAEFESCYNMTLDPDILRGYKKRYLRLDYELFCGIIDHLFDNFRPTNARKYPIFVDFNSAKGIVKTNINIKKKPEPDKEIYISSNASKTFGMLLTEINRWYDFGVLWKVNGELKPLEPRKYQTPIDTDQWIEMDCPPLNCPIFDFIQRKSIPYYKKFKETGEIEPLEKYYIGALESLKKIRKERMKNGEYRK